MAMETQRLNESEEKILEMGSAMKRSRVWLEGWEVMERRWGVASQTGQGRLLPGDIVLETRLRGGGQPRECLVGA